MVPQVGGRASEIRAELPRPFDHGGGRLVWCVHFCRVRRGLWKLIRLSLPFSAELAALRCTATPSGVAYPILLFFRALIGYL